MVSGRPLWTIIGILLLGAGLLSLILALVGLEWKPLAFLYTWGSLTTIILQLLLVISGFVILFIARTAPPR